MTTRAQPRRFQSIGSSSTGADKSSAVQGTNAVEVERPRPLEAWNALAHHVITVEAGKVRIGVHGVTLKALFEEAARGLAVALGEADRSVPVVEYRFQLKAIDRNALLAAWLRELVVESGRSARIFANTSIVRLSEVELEAIAYGWLMREPRLRMNPEMLQDLHVRASSYGCAVSITFDGCEMARVPSIPRAGR